MEEAKSFTSGSSRRRGGLWECGRIKTMVSWGSTDNFHDTIETPGKPKPLIPRCKTVRGKSSRAIISSPNMSDNAHVRGPTTPFPPRPVQIQDEASV